MKRIGSIGITKLRATDSLSNSKKVLWKSASINDKFAKPNPDLDSLGYESEKQGCHVWRLSEDNTWTFRKLIARSDFLYVLASRTKKIDQIVEKIPMESIFDVESYSLDEKNSLPNPAQALHQPTPLQQHLEKSINIQRNHALHGTLEYRAQRGRQESVTNSTAAHAFQFHVKIRKSSEKQIKYRKKQDTDISSAVYDFSSESRPCVFRLGPGAMAKEHCENWISVIKSASESARISAQRQKNRKSLQDGLRHIYDAKPFQVALD